MANLPVFEGHHRASVLKTKPLIGHGVVAKAVNFCRKIREGCGVVSHLESELIVDVDASGFVCFGAAGLVHLM